MSDVNDSKSLEDRFILSEEQLLAQLGAELVGPQALPLKPNELAERARRWLVAQEELLALHVCSSEPIKQFTLAKSDNSEIAVEVAKLLAGLLLPVNPVTLAVLLVKKGLKSLCSTKWGAA